jgi:uronate dehydrogenase
VIAITGAAGVVGSVLARELGSDLRLLDIRPGPGIQVVDLRQLDAVERAFTGVEKAVHLGAIPSEAPFEAILDGNLRTTYNVYEAARRQGVRRVVFASSNHAIGMYPRTQPIGSDDPVRPDTYYGASKAFGESLGRLYADKWGLEVACVRIGSFLEKPANERHLATWLSHRDGVALFRACLDAPLKYTIVFGISNNRRAWWDMSAAQALGYSPVDDAEAFAGEVGPDPSAYLAAQGGTYADPDFRGDR